MLIDTVALRTRKGGCPETLSRYFILSNSGSPLLALNPSLDNTAHFMDNQIDEEDSLSRQSEPQ